MPQSHPFDDRKTILTADSLFSISGGIVLPGWLLLVFLPKWKYSASLIAAIIIPVLLGLLYVWLIFSHMGESNGGFGTLQEVRSFFLNDHLLLAGWVHYLAFDLFVGSWEIRDAQQIGLRHLVVVPCLVLTFLLGPSGLLLYLGVRVFWKRRWVLANA